MLGRILLTGLLTATLMFAQGKKGSSSRGPDMPSVPFSGGNRLDRISDLLKLTKDQKKDLKSTFDDAQKEATPVHEQMTKARLEIGEAIAGGKSQDDIAKACTAESQLEAQMAAIELRAFTKVALGLEGDQRQHAAGLYQMMRGMFNGKNWMEMQ
jgi:Spy/CpxP family protein refolding chaperone